MEQKQIETYLQQAWTRYILGEGEGSARKEEEMKRAEALKKYGTQIKTLPDGRYYICVKKKKLMGRKLETVLDRLCTLEEEKTETFGECMTKWLPKREKEIAAGGYMQEVYYYRTYVLGSELEKVKVAEYSEEDVRRFEEHIRSIKKNLTKKYLKNVFGMLSKMCTEYGAKNLWKSRTHRDNFYVSQTPKQERWFTEEEAKAVAVLAKEEALAKGTVYPLGIVLTKCTGIRIGELCALTWDCVNGGSLNICREVIKTQENGKFSGYVCAEHPKTEAGRRSIPLNGEAKEALCTIRRIQEANGCSCGKTDFIFGSKTRPFPNSRCFDKRLRRYCRETGMQEEKSMHDLRRSFATRLYLNGCSVETIQRWMGHSTTEQTRAYIMEERRNETEEALIALA